MKVNSPFCKMVAAYTAVGLSIVALLYGMWLVFTNFPVEPAKNDNVPVVVSPTDVPQPVPASTSVTNVPLPTRQPTGNPYRPPRTYPPTGRPVPSLPVTPEPQPSVEPPPPTSQPPESTQSEGGGGDGSLG